MLTKTREPSYHRNLFEPDKNMHFNVFSEVFLLIKPVIQYDSLLRYVLFPLRLVQLCIN